MPSRAAKCPVQVAAIGCGYWGKNLVRNFAELGALAAICDPTRTAAAALADRYHAPVATVDAVLRDDEIVGVAIAAPAALHADLARRAIEAGKPSLSRSRWPWLWLRPRSCVRSRSAATGG